MTIGNKIYELRNKKNLSQEQLGNELGVSRQAISKWETDETIPSMDKLISLSKFFDVTIEEIVSDSKIKIEKDNTEKYKTIQMLIKCFEKIGLVILGLIALAMLIEIIVLVVYFIKNGTLPM